MWRWGAHDCIPIMYIGREGKQKGNSFHRARRSDTSKETEKREIEKKRNSEKNRREGKQKGTTATRTQKPQPCLEHNISQLRAPALTNNALSHAHAASPLPPARTHDTNTKRNRNRIPDWGLLRRLVPLNVRPSRRRCHRLTIDALNWITA